MLGDQTDKAGEKGGVNKSCIDHQHDTDTGFKEKMA